MTLRSHLWLLILLLSHQVVHGALLKASCHMAGSDVEGLILFMEETGENTIEINGLIDGLSPGKHGLTINEQGDITEGCDRVGRHYNPFNASHGVPDSPHSHLGDLGNVDATAKLLADFRLTSKVLRISGQHSIVNRSCVVYEHPDDQGTKTDALSKDTGNMGKPLCCGLIRSFGKGAGDARQRPPAPRFVAVTSLLLSVYWQRKLVADV